MRNYQRVFTVDGVSGDVIDISHSVNDFGNSPKIPLNLATGSKIYLGTDLPFHFRYFQMSVVNAASITLTFEYWNGNDWTEFADVYDGTNEFTANGNIELTSDQNHSWARVSSTSNTMTNFDDLADYKVYNMYWMRITITGVITSTAAFDYIGFKFSNDNDFTAEYPELMRSEILTAFQAGKTNWNNQHIRGAEETIGHIRKKQMLVSPNQIIDTSVLRTAAMHMTSFMIMRPFGSDYDEQRKSSYAAFKNSITQLPEFIDDNGDGKVDLNDRFINTKITRD